MFISQKKGITLAEAYSIGYGYAFELALVVRKARTRIDLHVRSKQSSE